MSNLTRRYKTIEVGDGEKVCRATLQIIRENDIEYVVTTFPYYVSDVHGNILGAGSQSDNMNEEKDFNEEMVKDILEQFKRTRRFA